MIEPPPVVDCQGVHGVCKINLNGKNKCTCSVKIYNCKFRALVDSGADISLISTKCFDMIKGKIKQTLTPCVQLSAVNGQKLKTLGRVQIPVQFNNKKYTHEFHVVDGIHSTVILGFDFIVDKEVSLIFSQNAGHMKIENEIIPLEPQEYINSLVRLAHDIVLPPQTGLLVQGTCKTKNARCIGVITATDTGFVAKEPGLLITNTVVNIKRKIPVSIVNSTNKTFHLKKGNVIGRLTTVDQGDISVNEVSNDDTDDNDNQHMTPAAYKQEIDLFIERNKDLFAEKDEDLGRTKLVEMNIDTGDHSPINLKAYRTPLTKRTIIEEQIKNMLGADVIRPSRSPWAFPVVIVDKKDGSKRFCVDYRKLNDITSKYQWNLPHIDDILASLGGSKHYSCLDLRSGYWQVPMNEKDRPKTAFISHKGLFEFNVLPFGLCNAPSVFCELMEKVVGDLKFVIAYLDDLIIFSKDEDEHIKHLEIVFDRLRKANLRLKMKKCEFFKSKLKYLGHVIDNEGVRPDEDKVKVIRELPTPKTVTDVRSFIGMASFYRKFIPDFSKIAEPLTKLTRKHAPFQWTLECEGAFEELKKRLCSPDILAFPDLSKEFILYTDASDSCIGAVLAQDFPEGEKPIQYLSHQLSTSQKKWPIIQKEAFAIFYAIQKFDHFLHGNKFTIKCDHKPLKFIFSSEMKNAQVQRWAIKISEHNCAIEYIEGKKNLKADMLSRLSPANDTVNVINTDKITPNEIKYQISEADKKQTDLTQTTPSSLVGNMAKEQDKDPELLVIKNKLRDPDMTASGSPHVLIDDILYYIPEGEPVHKLVIPESLKALVLSECHDNNCHLGMDKTYDKIRSKYHWRGLFKDVTTYVKNCVLCASNSMRKDKRPLQEMDKVHFPMEKVAIDTCGPYPESHNGNKYLITMIDMYSGWPEMYPVPDKSAETVAHVMLNHFIPTHACPLVLLSDNGTEFCNKIIDKISEKMNILRIRTSTYHPRSNGKVERLHRVWNMIASKQLQNDARLWDTLVPSTLSAIRTSVNESNKQSPFFLLFNREPVLPLDTILMPRFRYLGEDFHEIALERQHEAYKALQRDQKQARERQKRNHDRHAKDISFEPGDPVYLYNNKQKHKFSTKWIPFYRIMKKKSQVNYTIKNVVDGDLQNVHVELLKPAPLDWNSPRVDKHMRKTKYVVPPSDSESNDDSDRCSINKENQFSDSQQREGLRVKGMKDLSQSENSLNSSLNSDSDSDFNAPLAETIPLARLQRFRDRHATTTQTNLSPPAQSTDMTQNTQTADMTKDLSVQNPDEMDFNETRATHKRPRCQSDNDSDDSDIDTPSLATKQTRINRVSSRRQAPLKTLLKTLHDLL